MVSEAYTNKQKIECFQKLETCIIIRLWPYSEGYSLVLRMGEAGDGVITQTYLSSA